MYGSEKVNLVFSDVKRWYSGACCNEFESALANCTFLICHNTLRLYNRLGIFYICITDWCIMKQISIWNSIWSSKKQYVGPPSITLANIEPALGECLKCAGLSLQGVTMVMKR